MKITLHYDALKKEDQMASMRILKSTDMAIVLFQITNNLLFMARKIEDQDPIEFLTEEISSLLDEHGIVINDIID